MTETAVSPLSARPWTRALLDGWVGAAAFAALFAVTLYVQLTSPINHDTAWYLHSADAFLDGGRLYQDVFFEVNPPLALFLTVPPVYLARAAGLFPADVFVACVFGFVAVSLLLVRALLGDHSLLPRSYRRGLLVTALLALAWIPARDFGQREHLMLVLCLPYLVLVALRASGSTAFSGGTALLCGVAAGLGLSLKPHFFILAAGLELYLLARRRSLRSVIRTEVLALAGVVAVYGAAVVLLTPDYVTRILPYGVAVYDSSFRMPLEAVLWRYEVLLLPVVALLGRFGRGSGLPGEIANVFCVAAGCFFLVYLVQMKGWDYQLYPVSASLVLVVGALLARTLALASAGAASRQAVGAVLTAAAVLSSLLGVAIWRGGYQNDFMDRMAPVVRQHAAGSAIYVFTSNVSHGFPLVNYSGVGWSSRFPTLWLLPGLERRRRGMSLQAPSENWVRLAEIERYLVEAVVADFSRYRPALVFVDRRRDKPYFGGLAFDYLEFFSADRRFAEIWTQYEPLETSGSYWIYKRRSGGAS